MSTASATLTVPRTPAPTGPLGNVCRDYQRIESALEWLSEHYSAQPTLAQIAARAHMSEFHFQRTFCRWVGLSPKKYVQYLTLEHAKRCLDESRSVLDAAYDAGLSSAGRLHDLFVTIDAVTPGEYKRHGDGMAIRYGYGESPFGECLLTHTDRGICGLAFVSPGGRRAALAHLTRGWEQAELAEDGPTTSALIKRVFSTGHVDREPLTLHLRGTRFQIKVWQALLHVPPGMLTTYEDLGRRIGHPGAARAVGTANRANPIAYLIPCHRAIRKSGQLGGYRWGLSRKLAMLTREAMGRGDRISS